MGSIYGENSSWRVTEAMALRRLVFSSHPSSSHGTESGLLLPWAELCTPGPVKTWHGRNGGDGGGGVKREEAATW